VQKSCGNCPSLLERQEAAQVFGKDIGAPVCARHGHALGKADASEEQVKKIQEHFAGPCPDFNKPKPVNVSPVAVTLIAKPNKDMMTEGIAAQSRPASCGSCKFLVNQQDAYTSLGFSSPICAAKGQVILSNRFKQEATACGIGVMGTSPMTARADAVELLPVYGEDFGYAVSLSSAPDPQDYATDRPVSKDDVKHGIKAWRQVTDPEGYGEPIYLPIFDMDTFDADDRARVPRPGDAEHPEDYVDHQGLVYGVGVEWMELDETPLLVSAAGLGKTEFARHMAMLMSLPFDRINFNKDTDPDEIRGTWLFAQGETRWKNGRLPIGWAKRRVTLLDEPNRAGTVIQEMLLPMTDNSKQFVLESAAIPVDLPDGTTVYRTPPPIVRDPYSFMILAINPAWDVKYHGTMELDGALVDRLAKIELVLPPREVEEQILMRAYAADTDGVLPKKRVLDTIMRIAADIRAQVDAEALPISWGIRPQIAVIRKSRFFKLHTAYKRAVADYFDPQTRQQILDIVVSHTS
jgi:MoxR-like ATPase